jgi:hypothetical protein
MLKWCPKSDFWVPGSGLWSPEFEVRERSLYMPVLIFEREREREREFASWCLMREERGGRKVFLGQRRVHCVFLCVKSV